MRDGKPSYLQRFALWGPTAKNAREAFRSSGPPRLFEYGFHLSDTLTAADLAKVASEMGLPAAAPSEGDGGLARIKAASAETGIVSNVVGLLPATGPQKDEVIVLMAHYDHVGTHHGTVYPGADDNASGSAVLLSAIPSLKRLQEQKKLNRSILFIWTAGEEKGLVGSHYYARNPLPGLGFDAITGVINVDMVGRMGADILSVIDAPGGVPTYWGELNPNYHTPMATVERFVADDGPKKLRRVRDLLVHVVSRAANLLSNSPGAQD